MKVVWTDTALRDLEDITGYVLAHYPTVAAALERRIRLVVTRIGRWPESARRSTHRDGVRTVPLGRYPYRIFYRVDADTVFILYVHHTARVSDD
jgi:toxin ParE1/3/4